MLWHSTGANNTTLKRYVQPDDNVSDRAKMLEILGVNSNRNDWNHISRQAGVHAWIGRLANGEVAAVQVGDWNKKRGAAALANMVPAMTAGFSLKFARMI